MKFMFNLFFITMAVYALLLYVLCGFEMGAVRQYSIGSNSNIGKSYGVKSVEHNTGWTTANNKRYTLDMNDNFPGGATEDQECSKSTVAMAVHPGKEKFYIKTTSQHMWLYDCLSADSSSSADDDNDADDDDYSHCPRFEIDREAIHKGRFKQDRVQRLLACPPKPDGAQDCTADKNGYLGLFNPEKTVDWEDCESTRTDRDCHKKIKFTEDQYISAAISIVFAYVAGVILLGYDGEDSKTIQTVRRLGAIFLVAAHVVAIILAIMFLSHTQAIQDNSGKCIGEYLEETLGMTLENDQFGIPSHLAVWQLVVTVVGAGLFVTELLQTKFLDNELLQAGGFYEEKNSVVDKISGP